LIDVKISEQELLQMKPHALAWVDVAILVAYLVGTVVLGLWAGRKTRDPARYLIAGGQLGPVLVGLSIFGTFVSSISFLALPSKALASNWNPFVFSLTLIPAAWIASRWFMPWYRASGSISAFAHLGDRFGSWAQFYTVICFLLIQLGRVATILYLVALVTAPLLTLPVEWIILVIGLTVVVSTWVGGIEAVIWTDAAQSLILVTGPLICLGALAATLGGPERWWSVAVAFDKFSLGGWSWNWTEATIWTTMAYGLCINLQNFGIDQNFVQRYLTARDDKAARRSIWLGVWVYVPVSALFLLMGTGLFVLIHDQPGRLPEGLDPLSRPDEVLPWFLATQLPTGLGGLVIAAVFAAAMSTISSSLHALATLTASDLRTGLGWGLALRSLRAPHEEGSGRSTTLGATTDRRELIWLRGAVVAWGLTATLAALAMTRVASALDWWWTWAGVFGGGTLGLFLLGRLPKWVRPQRGGAVFAALAGVSVIAWMTLSPSQDWMPPGTRNPLHPWWTIVGGTGITVVTGALIAMVFGRAVKHASPSTNPRAIANVSTQSGLDGTRGCDSVPAKRG
jgi:SSS family solute:Na+ symporter